MNRVVAIRDGRTSTETLRRVAELEQTMKGEAEQHDEEDQPVSYEEFVIVEAVGGCRYQRHMEPTEEGLLIRPAKTGEEEE